MKVLTESEKNLIASVLLDSNLQQILQDNPQDPRSWALSYVYDSKLRKQFEDQLTLSDS